jgi:hypothetical protein
MVARVQWSHDLTGWHESGATADGLTRVITIAADGARRIAAIETTGTAPRPLPLYLRLAVTSGEPPALRTP